MMTNNETSKSFNEVGVEAFIIACVGTLNALPSIILLIIQRIIQLIAPKIIMPSWLTGFGNVLTWFGYVFCVLAIALAIYAFIDMFKHNKRGYYGFSIAAPCVAICGPAVMIGVKVLIIIALYL